MAINIIRAEKWQNPQMRALDYHEKSKPSKETAQLVGVSRVKVDQNRYLAALILDSERRNLTEGLIIFRRINCATLRN